MRTSIVVYFIGSLLLVFTYQNCSAIHEESSSLSSFDACNLVLKEEFSNGYHELLQTNCNGCHVNSGTGNGAFADADLDIAFNAFNVRGNTLIGSRALDPNHQFPFSGPQHQADIDQLDQTWGSAKVQADVCVANAGIVLHPDIETGIIAEDVQPTSGTIETYVQLIQADKDGTVITWNLENEILSPAGLSLEGASLQLEVTGNTTVTGEKSYIINNIKVTAGTEPLHFQYLAIKINNRIVTEATGFHQLNRRIPAGQERDVSTGSMIFRYDVRATDTISIFIGNLEPIAFNPPTFADLIAPGGIFAVNCMGCHDGGTGNPQAGFDISTRDAVLSQLMVSPFSPNNSEIFKRMNDTQAPMPQDTGLLPNATVEQVLWWIQDGAQ